MTKAEIIERQALRELLALIREVNAKEEEENHEYHHPYNRCNTGQPEAAR